MRVKAHNPRYFQAHLLRSLRGPPESETKNARAPSGGHADDCKWRAATSPRFPWDCIQNQDARGKSHSSFSQRPCVMW